MNTQDAEDSALHYTTALPAGEVGATAVEYALLVALIAGVIVAIVITLGGQVADLYNLLVGAF